MFEEYIPLNNEEIKEIWNNSIIVPDTNILLHLYRYSKRLRDRLLSILKNEIIIDKIWIPAKVYEEFLKNRPKVLVEQWSREDIMRVLLDGMKNDFDKKVEGKFSNRNHHPYIDVEEIKDKLQSFINELLVDISNEKRNIYDITFSNDMILNEVINIFNGKIGAEIEEAELESIIKEGEERYKQKIPPGFADAKKDGNDKYSDLIIWKSIMKYAKNKTNIIFVSDDRKEDWWEIISNKTVGLLPSLRKEFASETNRKILIYRSEEFYEYMDNYITKLKILTSDDKKDIKKISYMFGVSVPYVRVKKHRMKYDVDEIVKWFFENYKDPAEGVPYESREGGYQYFNGGPYEAKEEICEEYPDIDEETLKKAVDIIENDGYEWVKMYEY